MTKQPHLLHLRIAEALQRHSRRFDKALQVSHPRYNGESYPLMPIADRRKLNDWFQARYAYLEEEYRKAINADDTCASQWLYDQRTRMPPSKL